MSSQFSRRKSAKFKRFSHAASRIYWNGILLYGGTYLAQIKLSDRLLAIAGLVPALGGVADVGTDHGYIPVWLSQNGHIGKIYATDINEAPLLHAKMTAAEFGLENAISFSLCDGLAALDGADISTVIIAGMGGENIADILSKALWTKQLRTRLILQPMTKSALLRSWLFENGYRVLSEQLVSDGLVYEILTAEAGEDEPYSPAELLTGHIGLIRCDPLFESRLDSLIEKTERAVLGLRASTRAEDSERLSQASAALSSLFELKKTIFPSET
ncbi:MAG: SAM-dependent methyltransferase [Clostridia bacterium]|nr:SAM-dependent methyltransferase [Clostridia bacterium]